MTTGVSAPLYRDPIYDGAADPTVIWNPIENNWWMFYTSRRANVDCAAVAWCHGTKIGIASSSDEGATWEFRGHAEGLDFEPGMHTYWAPEIVDGGGVFHMYATYIRGVHTEWGGTPLIVHYTSDDLWNWKYESTIPLSPGGVIDACVHPLPEGGWRMFYKDCSVSHTYAADSQDLYQWRMVGPVITDREHEGPNVFQWRGYYWMVTDPWAGLGVYRSSDMQEWTRQPNILDRPGTRNEDGVKGGHADVVVAGDEAYVFYFTHPERLTGLEEDYKQYPGWVMPYSYRRTSIQVAKLECQDGQLTCDRDRPFRLRLRSPEARG